MFAEQAFDVKFPASAAARHTAPHIMVVTPPRDDRSMLADHLLAPPEASTPGCRSRDVSSRDVGSRAVYLRRRTLAAAVAIAALALTLALGRPDTVPAGESGSQSYAPLAPLAAGSET